MAATWQEENVERRRSASFASAAGSNGDGNGEPLLPPASNYTAKRRSMVGNNTSVEAAAGAAVVGEVVTTPMIDRVVFLGRVGEGETGVVYRAFDLLDLRLVAVKVIPVNNQKKRRQLVHEVSSLYDRLGMMMRGRRPRRATGCETSESDVVEASRETQEGSLRTKEASKTASILADPQAGSEHILELMDVFATTSNSTVSLVVEYMDGGSLQVGYAPEEEMKGVLVKHLAISLFHAIHVRTFCEESTTVGVYFLNSRQVFRCR